MVAETTTCFFDVLKQDNQNYLMWRQILTPEKYWIPIYRVVLSMIIYKREKPYNRTWSHSIIHMTNEKIKFQQSIFVQHLNQYCWNNNMQGVNSSGPSSAKNPTWFRYIPTYIFRTVALKLLYETSPAKPFRELRSCLESSLTVLE